jgi:hypothetical protein
MDLQTLVPLIVVLLVVIVGCELAREQLAVALRRPGALLGASLVQLLLLPVLALTTFQQAEFAAFGALFVLLQALLLWLALLARRAMERLRADHARLGRYAVSPGGAQPGRPPTPGQHARVTPGSPKGTRRPATGTSSRRQPSPAIVRICTMFRSRGGMIAARRSRAVAAPAAPNPRPPKRQS